VDPEQPDLDRLERPAMGRATPVMMTDFSDDLDMVPLIKPSSISVPSEFGVLDSEVVLSAPSVDRAVEGIVGFYWADLPFAVSPNLNPSTQFTANRILD
jgi:hypothetical protein